MTPADLRAARKQLGLTQKGLAAALRMGTHGWQTISKWESDSNERGVPGPAQVGIESLLPAEVTPQMIEAGFRVLAASGIADELSEADKLTIEEMYRAMERARKDRDNG